MHGAGFEPARLSTYELESYPLDHSGIRADQYYAIDIFILIVVFKSLSCLYSGTHDNDLNISYPCDLYSKIWVT